MAQTFHTFKADSLDEAYRAMRNKLGESAIVIRTTTNNENGIMGLLGKKRVEITATAPAVNPLRKLSPAEKKYAATMFSELAERDGTEPAPSTASHAIGSDASVRDTVAYFKQVVTDAQQRMNVGDSATAGTSTRESEGNAAIDSIIPFHNPREKAMQDTSSVEIRNELRGMRDMLNILSAETPGAGLPTEFAPHYRMLLDRGVDRSRAANLVSDAGKTGDLEILRNPVIFLERLKMEIRRHITVTGGIPINANKRRIVALAGPTGVGKTTTLAKLAAVYAVQRRAQVGIITSDTYRVAAAEQLKVYANIIGLEMRVVHEPRELTTALRDFQHCDLVLLDTAGGSPFNTDQMSELERMLLVAHPDEVMLILSASTPLEDLREIHAEFSRLKPTSLMFTKLDETRRYGPLYSLAAETGLPLSYFSSGQNVPDDVELANDGLVANLVIEGGDRRGTARAKTS